MAAKQAKTEQISMDLPSLSADHPVNVFRPNDLSPEKKDLIRRHMLWLGTIQNEYPMPTTPYRIGVYIRYFNQTKYKNYLDYHKKEFAKTIALYPRWTLVDFYVDRGQTAPTMENAPELRRLLEDCFNGKVDLIVTQKVSNMSRKAWDLTFLLRLLAVRGIGVYFINEDIFSTASYYMRDLQDVDFMLGDPDSSGVPALPGEAEEDAPFFLPGGDDAD